MIGRYRAPQEAMQLLADLKPEDRAVAVDFAWRGVPKSAALAGVIFAVLGAGAVLLSFRVTTSPAFLLGVLAFIGGTVHAVSASRAYARRCKLRDLGKSFLAKVHSPFCATMETTYQQWFIQTHAGADARTGGAAVTWEHTGVPLNPAERDPPHFKAPGMLSVTAAFCVTPTSLVVRPAARADTVAQGQGLGILKRLAKSLTSVVASTDTVDVYDAILKLARSADSATDIRLGRQASAEAEFFFSEMVNVEESSTGLRLSLRDGRTLSLDVPSEFRRSVTDGLRRSKQSPYQAPGPDVVAAAAGGMKTCPMCAEDVKAAARVCRFCQHQFN